MSFFRDLPIRRKFYLIYSVVIVSLIAITFYCYKQLSNAAEISLELKNNVNTHYIIPARLNNDLVNLGRSINFAVQSNSDNLDLQKTDNLANLVAKEINAITADISSPRVQELRNNAANLLDTYRNKIRPKVLSKENSQAFSIYKNEFSPLSAKTTDLCTAFLIEQLTDLRSRTDKMATLKPAYTIVIISSIIILLMILFAFYTARDFNRVVSFIVKAADRTSNLDLSRPILVNRKDEFGTLQESFEKLRISFSNHVENIKNTAEQVASDSHNVQHLMQTTSSNVSTAESNTLTVAAAADEMVSTTEDIARNCEQAAAASQHTREITNQSMESVRKTVNDIISQADQTRKDASLVQSLVTQSRNINSIVETINDIAAQTNLLALNASIEAARAGEYGRGFAVVADEVRALAKSTSTSTKEISTMVHQIQKEANDAAASMNSSVESMDVLAKNASSVDEMLQTVLGHVNEVNAQITQIATAAEEQTAATTEISKNMQYVIGMLHDVADNTHNSVDHVNATVNIAHSLQHDLAEFKLEK